MCPKADFDWSWVGKIGLSFSSFFDDRRKKEDTRKNIMLKSAYKNIDHRTLGTCSQLVCWVFVFTAIIYIYIYVYIYMNFHTYLGLRFGATWCMSSVKMKISIWIYLVVISLQFKVLVTWECTQLQINIIFFWLKRTCHKKRVHTTMECGRYCQCGEDFIDPLTYVHML
jgi:hypothetical protein